MARCARRSRAGVERGDQHAARAASAAVRSAPAPSSPARRWPTALTSCTNSACRAGHAGYSASSASAMPSGSYSATGGGQAGVERGDRLGRQRMRQRLVDDVAAGARVEGLDVQHAGAILGRMLLAVCACPARGAEVSGALPPNPHQGALPLESPPRAEPLEPFTWLGGREGGRRAWPASPFWRGRPSASSPSRPPSQTDGLQRPCLCWGSRGQSPLAGSGAEPPALPRPPGRTCAPLPTPSASQSQPPAQLGGGHRRVVQRGDLPGREPAARTSAPGPRRASSPGTAPAGASGRAVPRPARGRRSRRPRRSSTRCPGSPRSRRPAPSMPKYGLSPVPSQT